MTTKVDSQTLDSFVERVAIIPLDIFIKLHNRPIPTDPGEWVVDKNDAGEWIVYEFLGWTPGTDPILGKPFKVQIKQQ